jgi:hypothetical protein
VNRISRTCPRLWKGFATESGQAIPTVYKNFGNKRRLLLDLINVTIHTRVPPAYDAVISQPTLGESGELSSKTSPFTPPRFGCSVGNCDPAMCN